MTSFARRSFGPVLVAACVAFSTSARAEEPAPSKTLTAADIERVLELRRAGKAQDAVAWLDQQPATLALDEQAIALRALAKYDLKDLESVAKDVARFREYPGMDAYVLTLLGHTYTDASTFQHLPLAKTYYMRALATAPDFVEAKLGQARRNALATPKLANADAVFAFEGRKDELPAGLYVRFAAEVADGTATALARAGDRGDDTLRLFELARTLTPDDPDPLRGAALTYVLQGKGDQAQLLLKELETRFPEHMDDVFYTRAVMARLAGKPDDAIEASRQAFTLRPDHVPALELAGELLFEQGKLEDVRPLIERVKKAGKPSDKTWMLSARYFLKRAEDIPTTKPDGMDDKTFAAEQAKRLEFLKQAMTESATLRNEQIFHVENLELLARICDTIGPAAKAAGDETKRSLAQAKKIAAQKKKS